MKNLIHILKIDEGFRGHPYSCGDGKRLVATEGHVTVGYGRNLDANPITEKEAEEWLARDVLQCFEDVRFHYNQEVSKTNVYYEGHMENVRLNVLASMCYAMGFFGFRKFEKLRKAFLSHSFDNAADEIIDSDFYRSELTHKRAERYAWMMRHGKYHPYYKIDDQ